MAQAREGRLLWLILLAACFAGAIALLVGHEPKARRLVANEDAALALLEELRTAEATFHEAEGRYAWLDELDGAGLLPQLELVTTTAKDGSTRRHGEAGGYRFDVLLPHQIQAGHLVKVVPQGVRAADDELRMRYFVLVARPEVVGGTGYRIFCTDDSGFVWVSEGVSDEAMRHKPPLPDGHLHSSRGADMSGHVWHRLDKLIPRGASEEVQD